MGSILSLLSTLSMLVGGATHPPADTTTFADAATKELVMRAMARHRAQDSTVHDYQAKIRYRLSFAFGKRAWADLPTVAVEEQDANISWQRPNDLRVDMLGIRRASQLDDINVASSFSRPWFVPRTLGDSIRIFGSRTPVQAAPHPLSPGAGAHYRFTAGDSITINTNGHAITIRAVTVEPKGIGRSYVAGKLWLDVKSGDVVRFTFRFVGTDLWERPNGTKASDTTEAGRVNGFISRILQIDADLEYGLQEDKYWMPFRQVISGRVTVPFGFNLAIPFSASTTFSDYTINSGTAVAFTVPFPGRGGRGGGNPPIPIRAGNGGRGARGAVPGDTTRRFFRNDSTVARERVGSLAGGGRYQIHRPPADSLRAYAAWGDSLQFEVTDAERKDTRKAVTDLANIVEHLPGKMTGQPSSGFGLEQAADIFRYNRVEGSTLSLTARVPLSIPFTTSYATVRYGFADKRVMADFTIRRDTPASRWTFTGGRDLVDLDPFAKGLTLRNSVQSALTSHDEGVYLLGQGARVTYETSLALGRELTMLAVAEDEETVGSNARAGFPRLVGSKGYFAPNPVIREGLAFGGGVRLENSGLGTRWRIDAEALHVRGAVAARLAADLTVPHVIGKWVSGRVLLGGVVGSRDVPQLELRAGGLGSVRGFDFNTQHGNANWGMQLDISKPARHFLRPVVFVDAGQAGMLASMSNTPVLVGGGIGLSMLDGLLRLELSHPITQRVGRGIRFDLLIGSFKW